MTLSFTGRKRIRKNFGRISAAASMPNLIEVQKTSYETFLQKDVAPDERGDGGLQAVFKSVFPIRDFPIARNSISSPTPSTGRNMTSRNASNAA